MRWGGPWVRFLRGGDLSFLEGCPFFLVAELFCGCGWQSFREGFRPRAMGQPVVLSTAKSPASQFVAWTQGTSLMVAAVGSAHGAFERDGKQFLCFDGKLHGELVEHVFGVTVDDEVHGRLGRDAALVAVE